MFNYICFVGNCVFNGLRKAKRGRRKLPLSISYDYTKGKFLEDGGKKLVLDKEIAFGSSARENLLLKYCKLN